jgi:hypothetical protein
MVSAQDRLRAYCNGHHLMRDAGNPQLAVRKVRFPFKLPLFIVQVTVLPQFFHVLKPNWFWSLLSRGSLGFPRTDILFHFVGTILIIRTETI